MEIKLVSINGKAHDEAEHLNSALMEAYNRGGKDMLDAMAKAVATLPEDSTLAEVVRFIEEAKVDPE